MYFVQPSPKLSVDILTDSQPMYRLIYQPTQHIYRHSADRYVARHVNREATDIFADCNLRLIGRVSVDISANTLADRLTCRSREYQHFR